MSDVRSAWKDTGERFAALGASLKAHYGAERDAESTDTDAESTKRDLGEAARRFAGAVQDAVDALGAAAQDPSVKEDVRRVGTSLADALSATFAEVSDDLRRMADRTPGGQAEAEPPPTATTGPDTSASAPAEPGAESASAPSEGDEPPPSLEPWGTP
jgi:hypothetical protein